MPYFLAQELIPGYLKGVEGTYHTPKGYYIAFENPEAFNEFDAAFPPKEKKHQEEKPENRPRILVSAPNRNRH